MGTRYVVWVSEADRGSPETYKRYVQSLCRRAYSHQEGQRDLTENRFEAVVFTTLAAAELTAVFVGGEVEEMSTADE